MYESHNASTSLTKKEKIIKIIKTVGSVLRWIFGLLLVLLGIVDLFQGETIVMSFACLLAGTIIIIPAKFYWKDKSKLTLVIVLKTVLVFVLIVIGVASLDKVKEEGKVVIPEQTKYKDVKEEKLERQSDRTENKTGGASLDKVKEEGKVVIPEQTKYEDVKEEKLERQSDRTENKSQVATTGRNSESTLKANESVELSMKKEYIKDSFFTIRNNIERMTEAQWKAYVRSLKGKRVKWTGWVEDVNEKWIGGYELLVDMDSPDAFLSVYDLSFDIPDDLALKLNKDQRVSFEGDISHVFNILGSCRVSLDEAVVVK